MDKIKIILDTDIGTDIDDALGFGIPAYVNQNVN